MQAVRLQPRRAVHLSTGPCSSRTLLKASVVPVLRRTRGQATAASCSSQPVLAVAHRPVVALTARISPASCVTRARQRQPHCVVAQYAVPAVVVDLPEEAAALPLPRAVESAVDDPMLHNPLQRMERLSTGWFGVIADYEGVVVDSTIEVHKEAWRQVAVEMNLPMPLGSTLNRIKGVRDEVVRGVRARGVRAQGACCDQDRCCGILEPS